jgi:alanine dehydrogenase
VIGAIITRSAKEKKLWNLKVSPVRVAMSVVPRTSTFALTNATFPYALRIANFGYREAMRRDMSFREGLNVLKGKLVCPPVAEAMGRECFPIEF